MDIFIHHKFYEHFQQAPLKLVDVGASGGVQQNWLSARKFLNVIGFEPSEKGFHELPARQDVQTTYLNSAVFREKGEQKFYFARHHEKSSIYPPNMSLLSQFPDAERFETVEEANLQVDTLDNQLGDNGIDRVDFIKLDTQGSELGILQGSIQALQKTIGLEIEVEFAEMYKGQPLFADVDAFMRQQGFALFDLKPFYWKRAKGHKLGNEQGQLIFADALYFKEIEVFQASLSNVDSDIDAKRQVLRALAIFFLYGYFDVAFELFSANRMRFESTECELIDRFFDQSIQPAQKLPLFRGRYRLANLFKKCYRFFDVQMTHWAKVGKPIGNRD